MTLDPELADIIRVTRAKLCARTPFLGSLALFAEIKSSEKIPTAATDGQNIFVNPQFFKELSTAEQETVLLHEVLHAALLHVSRGKHRDAKRWNIAADIVTNGILVKEGYQLTENGIRDKWLERFSVEEVYDLLEQPHWKRKNMALEDPDLLPGSGVEGLTADDFTDESLGDEPASPTEGQIGQEQQNAQKDFWERAREQASVMAESSMHGTLPASVQRELDKIQESQLDWRHYLWRYLVRTPIDFTGFDRRFVGRGTYLETLEGETVHIAVAVDTSGSIKRDQISQFVGEVQAILQAYPHLQGNLYYADTKLYGPHRLKPNTDIPPPVGRGGTDFRPFFEKLELNDDPWTTTIAVYLTDGFGRFPQQPPTFPILWVVTPGGKKADQFPFGEVVRLVGDSASRPVSRYLA